MLFRAPSGQSSPAQRQAFEDTWHWTEESEQAFGEVLRGPSTKLSDLLDALRKALGENDMMAYLAMMAVRLIELHRVLKQDGALYLHCDPAASHYLKVLLDGVFGAENFRSEIVWRRSSSHNSVTRQFGPVHDIILFYARSTMHKLRPVLGPHIKSYIEGEFRFTDRRGAYRLNEIMGPGVRMGESGKPWRGYDPTSRQRHWAIPDSLKQLLPSGGAGLQLHQQLDELDKLGEIHFSSSGRPKYKQRPTLGVPLQDVWAYQPGTEGTVNNSQLAIDRDVKWLDNDAEKLGYPTQKPVGLLARIIKSSSDENGVVLDPFCGCGTAVLAAEGLKRQWIGIDVTHLSVDLIERRLRETFVKARFKVHGTPRDHDGARDLARRDKHEFQLWAVARVGGIPFQGGKKGADSGIDGLIYFRPDGRTVERAVISIKGGENISVAMVRDFAHVVAREKARVGVFVTLTPPTKPMTTEAYKAGFYESEHGRHLKIQILTVEDLMAGKKPDIPLVDTSVFRRASAHRPEQGSLLL